MKKLFTSSAILFILSGHPVSASDILAPETQCGKLAENCGSIYHNLKGDSSTEDYQKCSDHCLASIKPCINENKKHEQVRAYHLYCKNQLKKIPH